MMIITFVTTFLGLNCLLGSAEFTFDDWDMRPGETKKMISRGYPGNAPTDLNQVWTIRTNYNAYFHVTCEDFYIPGNEPCGDSSLSYMDMGDTKFFCGGERRDVEFITTSGGLFATLRTGSVQNGARLSCTVRALRKQVTGPTTEGPWSFLDMDFEEVDSAEHGGPRGPSDPTCPCGWANKDQMRVINGREAKVNEFPFMGLLKYRWMPVHFCTASLITEYHGLTAAHCMPTQKHKLSIVLGEHDVLSDVATNNVIEVEIKEYIIHPNYGQPHYLVNDIALLVLRTRVQFSKIIGPVCLPTAPMSNLKGEYVKVIGWGVDTKYPGRMPPLQKADLKVLSKENCHMAWRRYVPEGSPNQLCLYHPKSRACNGDSGGPVVWVDPTTNRYTQIGITSYGNKNCTNTLPGVITDVSTYLDWIKDNIRATYPTARICTRHV